MIPCFKRNISSILASSVCFFESKCIKCETDSFKLSNVTHVDVDDDSDFISLLLLLLLNR